jgi:hypothetical protein
MDTEKYLKIADSIENELTNHIQKEIVKKLDYLVIEGLRIKGYEFDNEEDLIEFIKENCNSHQSQNVILYSVKGEFFMKHVYNMDFNLNPENDCFSVEFGHYEFL